jgi:protein involved in polysaccharide export with SLBB domain
LFAAAAGVLCALVSPALHAQCGDDPDSIDCQMQQPVNTAPADGESPTTYSLTQPAQAQPRADQSNEATANGSLSNGSNYTEPPSPQTMRVLQQPALTPMPPEPPTEFQRFVQASTGQKLPVFGSDLFSDQRTLFGPVLRAPAPADMIVGPDDELRIRIWGQVNFSANLRVSREGEIYLPKVGSVHVAGLPVAAVQDHLRQALERIYRNFEISVDLGEIHSIEIYITGHARRPGEYTVSALSTLVDAVFSSGGPSTAGSMRHIELKRDGKVLTDFDLYSLLVEGDKTGDMQLQPGDVIYIPATGPQAALLGSVREPAIYELRGRESLGAALAGAGGETAMAEEARISVDRISTGGIGGDAQRRAFELAGDAAGMGAALADGDIVRVDAITSNYRDTVTLRGSVANPGRFRWHAGMRLSELIPDRDSLLSRGYWWRRTQLGFPAPEFASPAEGQPGDYSAQSTPGVEANSISRQPARGGFVANGGGEPADTPAALPSPQAQTNWDYAVIERLDPVTMKTSLISFDLGKLVLEHDASQDRELMPGDVVTIFSQDQVSPPVDRKTVYVQLDGEVANAGVYSVSPGETLRSVVMRAGGLTAKAYLYGAEFTRKSTQALEQQRLNDYADRQEQLMERSALALSAASNEAAAGPQQGTAGVNRDLVARLRLLRARGRIVLNLSPESNSAADLPEIPLEDGDRLVVPARPSTIQVIGAVFNQNAFLYHRGARVSEYLRYAGGPTREADRGQAFVLRADGSVFSRGEKQSIFAQGGLENVRLYPGDTIVVPEKMVKPSALREMALWTQMMSELSVSAAAVDVIK